MLILGLDTSSPSGSIAVLRDNTIIASAAAWTGEIYSSRIFRQVESIFGEFSIGMPDIDLFAVAVGPGSFTGLRVGLTAVKAWSEVYRKPIAAISALEAVASQSVSAASILVPVLDARRAQVYFAVYKRSPVSTASILQLEGTELVSTPHEFLELLDSRHDPDTMQIVTPVPELITTALSRYETTHANPHDLMVEEVSSMLAPQIAKLGASHAQRGRLVDSLTLDANYVRRSDAELHWKAPAGS